MTPALTAGRRLSFDWAVGRNFRGLVYLTGPSRIQCTAVCPNHGKVVDKVNTRPTQVVHRWALHLSRELLHRARKDLQ